MKQLSLAILLLTCLHSFAQTKWFSRDLERLEDADIYLEITDYKSALELYKHLYEKHGSEKDLDYKIGLCYYNLGELDESLSYFEKASESNINAHFYLGLYNHRKENLKEAIDQFVQFKAGEGNRDMDLASADRMIEICERAEKMMSEPVDAMVYNLGEKINSEYDEYSPWIKGDESMMAFTSRRLGTGGKKDPYGEYLEDIYFADRQDEKWQNVKNAGPPLNSETHDAVVGLSSDGLTMIIYRTNKELTAGDLYISHNEDGKWSKLKKLDEAINSDYQEASAAISNDERTIFFSSNRPGGYGGKDIYRVVRITEEIWSLPLNLGPTINTEHDEDAPFLHHDEEMLYFSSRGHKSMGGYDIFVSSVNDDYWSMPENIGYPANTVGDDIFFVLAEDGKRGYYSSEREDGYGGHDIYAVSFEDEMERLRIVKGNVSNESGEALTANIDVQDEEGQPLGTYATNSVTGNYVIVVPPNKDFQISIEADGYVAQTDELHYIGGTNVREKVKNYTLVKSIEQ